MHGILASMAEFYSLNLAQEVLKGMTQRAAIGGTPTKAPLGYLNVRTTDARGRESREIEIDPERADLVRFAFTAYATGDWSLSRLAKELTACGLTTRPTPSQPAKPVTTTGLHKILTPPTTRAPSPSTASPTTAPTSPSSTPRPGCASKPTSTPTTPAANDPRSTTTTSKAPCTAPAEPSS